MAFWTAEKVEVLRAQWVLGESVKTIAVLVGATRNAVIGKARRIHLPMHGDSAHHPDKARKPRSHQPYKYRDRRRHPVIVRFKTKALPAPDLTAPEPLRIPFIDLEPHHCRYSVSDAHDGPWCAFHHELCTTKPRLSLEQIATRRAA